jgi:hypothetical protein
MSIRSGNSGGAAAASPAIAAPAEPHVPRLQAYVDAIVGVSRDAACTLRSILLFGSSVIGGYSESVSDVDLILVLADETSRDARLRLGEQVKRLEVLYGFGDVSRQPQNVLESFLQKVTANVRSFFICTHGDFAAADAVRIFDITPAQGIFVDRIVLASILGSAKTVWGEDLLPRAAAALPPIRRGDVLKVFFYSYNQVVLSANRFPRTVTIPAAAAPDAGGRVP